MHVKGYEDAYYQEELKKLHDQITEIPTLKIIATDISEDAIKISKVNAGIAGVEQLIDFAVCDFEETKIPKAPGVVYLNPEYGERLGEVTELETTYARIGDFLKKKCQGYLGYIFTGNLDLAKKIGLKKVTLSVIIGAVIFWLIVFFLNKYYNASWLLIIPIAFLFGVFFQASWPLALYSQETEEGVTDANVGIAASLYISISNIGAAVLPVVFPLIFTTNISYFIAITAGLIICILLWAIVKRK
jgi:hypothetical protein